jgi:hypothetical protein
MPAWPVQADLCCSLAGAQPGIVVWVRDTVVKPARMRSNQRHKKATADPWLHYRPNFAGLRDFDAGRPQVRNKLPFYVRYQTVKGGSASSAALP